MTTKQKFEYEYPRAAIAADIIVIANNRILLIRRKNDPYKGMLALPGGFFDPENDCSIEYAAVRELKEETGINLTGLNLFNLYDKKDRDPRHRTVSLVYHYCLKYIPNTIAGDDAAEIKWLLIPDLWFENLAFDHKKILYDFLKIESKFDDRTFTN